MIERGIDRPTNALIANGAKTTETNRILRWLELSRKSPWQLSEALLTDYQLCDHPPSLGGSP